MNTQETLQKIIHYSLDLSKSQGYKGTILRGKDEKVIATIKGNTRSNSSHMKELMSNDFNLNYYIEKAKPVLEKLKKEEYDEEVKKFINETALMFMYENLTMQFTINKPKQLVKIDHEKKVKHQTNGITCSKCGETHMSPQDISAAVKAARDEGKNFHDCKCGNTMFYIKSVLETSDKIKKSDYDKSSLDKLDLEEEETTGNILEEINLDE